MNESSTTVVGGKKRKALNEYWTEYLLQATKTAKVQEIYYQLKIKKLQGQVEKTSGLLILKCYGPIWCFMHEDKSGIYKTEAESIKQNKNSSTHYKLCTC